MPASYLVCLCKVKCDMVNGVIQRVQGWSCVIGSQTHKCSDFMQDLFISVCYSSLPNLVKNSLKLSKCPCKTHCHNVVFARVCLGHSGLFLVQLKTLKSLDVTRIPPSVWILSACLSSTKWKVWSLRQAQTSRSIWGFIHGSNPNVMLKLNVSLLHQTQRR